MSTPPRNNEYRRKRGRHPAGPILPGNLAGCLHSHMTNRPSLLAAHATREHDRGSDTHHEQSDAARDEQRQTHATSRSELFEYRLPLALQGDVLVLQRNLRTILIGGSIAVGLSIPSQEHVSVALERLGRVGRDVTSEYCQPVVFACEPSRPWRSCRRPRWPSGAPSERTRSHYPSTACSSRTGPHHPAAPHTSRGICSRGSSTCLQTASRSRPRRPCCTTRRRTPGWMASDRSTCSACSCRR